MSVLKACGILLCVCMMSACATSQLGLSASAAADKSSGVASALNVNVANAVVRVVDLENESLLRAELEEFKAGLFWSRGLRATDAVIEIGGEGSSGGRSAASIGASRFGQTELYGTVSLIDVATGNALIEPIFIEVSVGDDRDARTIGLTTGSKRAVELEYLVQKFILAGREALYGKGN